VAEPIKVYSPIKWNTKRKSACAYYRVEVPFLGMSKLGEGEVFIDEGIMPEDQSIQYLFSADVDLFYALAGEGLKPVLTAIKEELKPGFSTDGENWRYPPVTVFDIDEALAIADNHGVIIEVPTDTCPDLGEYFTPTDEDIPTPTTIYGELS